MATHILAIFQGFRKVSMNEYKHIFKWLKIEICRWLDIGHDSWTIHKQQKNNDYSVYAISLSKEEENAARSSNSLAKNKWVSLVVLNCHICFSS
jgi:hypothetical protein